MEKLKSMLLSHPIFDQEKSEQVAHAIEKNLLCASICRICADACISEKNPDLDVCIKNNLMCSEFCQQVAVVLTYSDRTEGARRKLIEACVQMCLICQQECASHAEMMEHCKICADCCSECAKACQELLSA